MSFNTREASTYSGAPFELFKFSMGSRAWYLTSGEEPRTYMTQVYVPEAIDRDDIRLNQETSSGSLGITLPLESSLAKEFISFMPPEPMWVAIYAGHDGDPEVIRRYYGKVAKATFSDVCKLLVQPQTAALKKKIPAMVYQPNCNRMHYSAACGAIEVSPGGIPNRFHVQVSAISGFQVTIDPGSSPEFVTAFGAGSGFPGNQETVPTLAWGKVVHDNTNRQMMIARHTTWNVVELMAPLVGLEVGDWVWVVRGCRRTVKHCAFYGRLASYMGFDLMPNTNPFMGVA